MLHTGGGLEPWHEAGGEAFTRWDLWFLAVLVADFDGSWSGLAERLWAKAKEPWGHGYDQLDREAKISHLEDLRHRVERCGVEPAALVGEHVGNKAILRKARTKVFEGYLEAKQMSPAMRRTPRAVLKAEAYRGQWGTFPVSPGRFEPTLKVAVRSGDMEREDASFGVCRRFRAALLRAEGQCGADEAMRLALYRAGLAVLLDAMEEGVDDSYGEVGEAFGATAKGYVAVAWTETGIAPEVYYRDLLAFAVWEDYAFFDERSLRPFFAAVPTAHVLLVDGILRAIRQELLEHQELAYQADKALTLQGEFHVAKRSFGRFVGLATEMGSREWRRIVEMAETAWRYRKRDLALAVYGAADQPGRHREFLQERCRELVDKG